MPPTSPRKSSSWSVATTFVTHDPAHSYRRIADESTQASGVSRKGTRIWRGAQLRVVAKVATLFVLYVSVAKLGLMLDAVSGFATLVWAPTGIALAALLMYGQRLCPGVWLRAFAVNLWAGAPWPVALGIASGNTLR